MRNLTRHIVILTITTTAVMALASCDKYDISGFFHSSSDTVNKRFSQSLEIDSSNADTPVAMDSNNYSVYVISDLHIKTTAKNLAQLIDIAATDPDAGFVAVLGDITDQKGGHYIAYDTINEHRPGTLPLYATVGNHDLYFGQWTSYKKLFGASAYYRTVQTPDTADLFVFLDSGNGTLGHDQYRWLASLLENHRPSYRHCIVATHTNFFDVDLGQMPTGSFTLEETAMLTSLFTRHNVTMVINGHDHHHETARFGTTLYITAGPAMDKNPDSGYSVLHIGDNITCSHHLFQ